MSNEATKNDDGKLRYDLIPVKPLELLAEVYTIGAKKYDDNNWRKGFRWGRVFAALMRHAWAYWRGERLDPVDGQHHLASVAWCAFTLMEFETTHPELDDRIKANKYPDAKVVSLRNTWAPPIAHGCPCKQCETLRKKVKLT